MGGHVLEDPYDLLEGGRTARGLGVALRWGGGHSLIDEDDCLMPNALRMMDRTS